MKNLHRLGIAVGLALSLSSLPSVEAADHAAIIAALPDEASACRYYLSLCQQLKASTEESDPLMREVNACNQGRSACTTPPTQWTALAARGKVQHEATLQVFLNVLEAMRVMQAKYPKPPACMATCENIMGECTAIVKSAQQGTPHP